MPASLKDLRNRIKSTRNTQQITKAMKLVSAAKFGRAQTAVVQARPYSVALSGLAGRLLESMGDKGDLHALLKAPDSDVVSVVVIASERGLCGGYNANIIKVALRTIDDLRARGKRVAVSCIGKRAFQALAKRKDAGVKLQAVQLSSEALHEAPEGLIAPDTVAQLLGTFDKPSYDLATRLARSFETLFAEGQIGELVVVYSKFQSAMTQVPTAETMLPITAPDATGEALLEPILEPSPESLIGTILPRYLATRLYQTLLEANASEHGARMTAMDSATRNAKDMERRLQITYQRARQAAITKELIEIISGAEAL